MASSKNDRKPSICRIPSGLVDVAARRKLDRRVFGESSITVPCVPKMVG